MSNISVEHAAAGTATGRRRELPSDEALSVEDLSRAVGENALLQTEVSRQMALRIVEMREDIRSMKTDMESLRTQVDRLVHGVSQALELTRSEWQRASQFGGTAQEAAAKSPVIPRLLSPEKLLKMGSDVRLNIGCGTKPLPDYLNVDERELDGVELIADVRGLPFKPGTLSEIYAAHVVEHFTEADLKSTVLPAWHSLLKPGAILCVVVPDAEGMIQAFSRGDYPFASLREVTYGGQDYPGNFHYTMFSRESLRTILREAGFTVGQYTALARPNGLCLEMEIKAVKKL